MKDDSDLLEEEKALIQRMERRLYGLKMDYGLVKEGPIPDHNHDGMIGEKNPISIEDLIKKIVEYKKEITESYKKREDIEKHNAGVGEDITKHE